MKLLILFGLLVLAYDILGQSNRSAINPKMREVKGQTIISTALPEADLTFGKEFRYVGSQRVNLYGNAEAEQHLFVEADNTGVVEKFYWVQFEHFLPTNTRTYDYSPDRTTQIGGMSFIYDVKSWPDYAALQAEDPQSDGAAVEHLLANHSLAFPKQAVRVRMFYLPAPDRRSELMIIYGESLPSNSNVPVRENGVELDKEAPQSATVFLEHAQQNLKIHSR
jgi:hypothetical protein